MGLYYFNRIYLVINMEPLFFNPFFYQTPLLNAPIIEKATELPAAPHQIAGLNVLNEMVFTLSPNNDPEFVKTCRRFGWQFPTLQFNFTTYRNFLECSLGECWGSGSAFAPRGGVYHDINLKFFKHPFPNFSSLKALFLSFIRDFLNQEEFRQLNIPHYDSLLLAAYFQEPEYTYDKEATFVLRTAPVSISVKIEGAFSHFSLASEDGVIFSLRRARMCISLGNFFANTMAMAQHGLAYHYNKICSFTDLRGRVGLFFPLMHALSKGCIVPRPVITSALDHLWMTGPKESRRNLISNRFKVHLKHFPHEQGKIIDSINQLSFIQHKPKLCELFAKSWIKNSSQQIGMIILKCPEIAPYLVAYMQVLFLCEWADNKMTAYEKISLPPGIPLLRASNFHGSIAYKKDKDIYHLNLSMSSSPFQVVFEGVKGINSFLTLLNQHCCFDLMKDVLALFEIDSVYLQKELFLSRVSQIFSIPHVQDILKAHFPQVKANRLIDYIRDLSSGDPHLVDEIEYNLARYLLEDCSRIVNKFILAQRFTDLLKHFLDTGIIENPEIFRLFLTYPEAILKEEEFQKLGVTPYFLNTLGKIMTCLVKRVRKWDKDQIYGLYEALSKLQILSEREENAILSALVPFLNEFSLEVKRKLSKEALERGMLQDILKGFETLIVSENREHLLCAHRYLDLLLAEGKKGYELAMRLIHHSCFELDYLAFSGFLYVAKKIDNNQFSPLIYQISIAAKNARLNTRQDALQIIQVLDVLLKCKLENLAISNIVKTIEGLILKSPKVLIALAPVIEKLAHLKLDLDPVLRSQLINVSLRLVAYNPNHESEYFHRGEVLLKVLFHAYSSQFLYEEIFKKLFKRMSDALLKIKRRHFKAYSQLASELSIDNHIKKIFRRLSETKDFTDLEYIRDQFKQATKLVFPEIYVTDEKRVERKEEVKESTPVYDLSDGIKSLCQLLNEEPENQNNVSKSYRYILLSLKNYSKEFSDEIKRLVLQLIRSFIITQRKLHIRYAESLFALAIQRKMFTPQQLHKDFLRGYIALASKYKTDWSDELFTSFNRWTLGEVVWDEDHLLLGIECFSYVMEGNQKDLTVSVEFLLGVLKNHFSNKNLQEPLSKSITSILNCCLKQNEVQLALPLIRELCVQNYLLEKIIPLILNIVELEEEQLEELFKLLSTTQIFDSFSKENYLSLMTKIRLKNCPYLFPYLLPFIFSAFEGVEEKGKKSPAINKKEATEVLLQFLYNVSETKASPEFIIICNTLLTEYEDEFKGLKLDSILDATIINLYCLSNDFDKVLICCRKLNTGHFKPERAVKVLKTSLNFHADQYNLELAIRLQVIAKKLFSESGIEESIFKLVGLLIANKEQNIRKAGQDIFICYIKHLYSKDDSFFTAEFAEKLIRAIKNGGLLQGLLAIRKLIIDLDMSTKQFDDALEIEILAQHDRLLKTELNDVLVKLKSMLDFYSLSFPELGQKALHDIVLKVRALNPSLEQLLELTEVNRSAQGNGLFKHKRTGPCQTIKISNGYVLSLMTVQTHLTLFSSLVEATNASALPTVCEHFTHAEHYLNGEQNEQIEGYQKLFLRLSTCCLFKACMENDRGHLDHINLSLEMPLEEIIKNKIVERNEAAYLAVRIPLLSHLAHRLCYLVPLMIKAREMGVCDHLLTKDRGDRIHCLQQLLKEEPFLELEFYNSHLRNGYFINDSYNDMNFLLQDLAKGLDMCETLEDFSSFNDDALNLTVKFFMRFLSHFIEYTDLFFLAYKENRIKGKFKLKNFESIRKDWQVNRQILFQMMNIIIIPLLKHDARRKFIHSGLEKRKKLGISEKEFGQLKDILTTRENEEKKEESKGPGVLSVGAGAGAGAAASDSNEKKKRKKKR